MVVQKSIEEKLQTALIIDYLQVINESEQHSVPENSETHFKLLIVSPSFEGKRAIARQQQVYQVLAEEMAGPVHALTMQTLTPDEWQAKPEMTQSPACLGGSLRDK